MTGAELAILSLIAEGPRHGYEIEALIEERGMREWTAIGFSSIYYVLKKLEKAGAISSTLQPAQRGPARRVYSITPTGMQSLREAVYAALSTPHHGSSPLQLGLANLPLLSPAEAHRALSAHLEALLAQREHLIRRRDEQRPLPPHVEAMFAHSLALLDAESDWLRDFIAAYDEQE